MRRFTRRGDRAARRPEVVLYTRQGCGLCRQAEDLLARLAGPRTSLSIVDIDAHPELTARYTVRVPVVVLDGEEIAELQVDERHLRRRLRQARRARPTGPTGGAAEI